MKKQLLVSLITAFITGLTGGVLSVLTLQYIRPAVALSDVVVDSHFTVLDDRGISRLRVSFDEGSTEISICDATGAGRIDMVADEYSSGFIFSDKSGAVRFSLGAGEKGGGLIFNDARGVHRAEIEWNGENSAIRLRSDDGSIVWKAE